MTEFDARNKLIELLKRDKLRMEILQAVSARKLPDAYVAAGFLRNLAWDNCHGFSNTQLSDIDVIYFDNSDNVDTQKQFELGIQEQLKQRLPQLKWDVKNQARMHIRNNHATYLDTSDAMSWWPEQETAVGVKLNNGDLHFVAPFGLARLFKNSISLNPKRDVLLFEERVQKKRWLKQWPQLKIVL